MSVLQLSNDILASEIPKHIKDTASLMQYRQVSRACYQGVRLPPRNLCLNADIAPNAPRSMMKDLQLKRLTANINSHHGPVPYGGIVHLKLDFNPTYVCPDVWRRFCRAIGKLRLASIEVIF